MAKIVPVSLRLKNFQCYADAELKFDFPSALIVGERDNNPETSNGSGKSSIFEAITWCLFNECKQKTGAAIVRRNSDECFVEFAFKVKDDTFKITRKKRKSSSDITLEKNGTIIDSDKKEDLNVKIQEIVGSSYEAFLATSYFMQRSISEILSGTPASRQKLLKSFINLDVWDKAEEAAKKKAKDLEVEQIKLASSMQECLLHFSEERIESQKKKISDTKKEIEKLTAEEKEWKEKVNAKQIMVGQLQEKLKNIMGYRSKVEELKNKIEKQEQVISSISKKIDDTDFEIAKNKQELAKLQKECVLSPGLLSFEMKERLREGETKLAILQSKIANYKPLEICQCCLKTWEEHENIKSEYIENNLKVNDLLEKIRSFKEKISFRVKEETLVEQTKKRINELGEQIERRALLVFNAIEEQRNFEAQVIVLKAELLEAKRQVSCLENIDKIPSADEELQRLIVIQANKESVIGERSFAEASLVNQEKMKAKHATLSGAHKTVSEQVRNHQSLVSAFGRKGIQAAIMDNVVATIVDNTNYWLSEFCYDPMSIKIITQKPDKKETFDIEITTNTGVCSFESLSGGEAFKVAFSMRLALAALQGNESSVLLLDEVSSSLDKHGLENFVNIIHRLEKQYKVLVITHDDQLKEKFQNIITVKRTKDYATIEQSI